MCSELAIQLIINKEWGLGKNENPNQGSFVIDALTDLVEEAVLKEFEAISSRGGVLGAMETGYQRGKIQEESLTYEHKKHDGSYEIVGVNTFRNPHVEPIPQKLKYHIQTSGRSLHAQEIAFNDIRTTLQALTAIYDNCNSLHTNAYDEAITTPTEESVRRAMAIQLIINKEWGLARNENPNQGSFAIDALTDLVEEAVLKEFEALSSRGGVLGAMETGYQRGKIQEESLYYEHRKHDGSYPIIGVNTFRNPSVDKSGEATPHTIELIRSTEEEKRSQLKRLRDFQNRNASTAPEMLQKLQQAVIKDENVFAVLMDAVRVCSLGQITHALFEVGGEYRRSM